MVPEVEVGEEVGWVGWGEVLHGSQGHLSQQEQHERNVESLSSVDKQSIPDFSVRGLLQIYIQP